MKKIVVRFMLYLVCGMFAMLGLALLLQIDFLEDYPIYLYKCVLYSILTVLVMIVVMAILSRVVMRFKSLTPEVIMSTALICLLGLFTFSSVVIMPMDRSYTIYSLADMYESNGKSYMEEEIEEQFVEEYIKKMGSTRTRINEQETIGNIEKTEQGYKITKKGQKLIEMYRMIDKIWPVDNRTSIYPSDK